MHRYLWHKNSGFTQNRRIDNAQQWIPLRIYLQVDYKTLLSRIFLLRHWHQMFSVYLIWFLTGFLKLLLTDFYRRSVQRYFLRKIRRLGCGIIYLVVLRRDMYVKCLKVSHSVMNNYFWNLTTENCLHDAAQFSKKYFSKMLSILIACFLRTHLNQCLS